MARAEPGPPGLPGFRPKASYKLSDEVLITLGANLFLGAHPDTFFGQFEDNTNAYARVRYSF